MRFVKTSFIEIITYKTNNGQIRYIIFFLF